MLYANTYKLSSITVTIFSTDKFISKTSILNAVQ